MKIEVIKISKANSGRPLKQTDDELKQILAKFASSHKGKITYLKLEKETGVKRHVWARRMSEEIKSLNTKGLSVNGSSFEEIELPNISDTIDKHWENKDDLISALSDYNLYIQKLWEKAVLQERASERESKLLSEIEDLKKENKFLKENRDFYKNEYEKSIVENIYYSKRVEKNTENIIDINNNKNFTSSNWEDQFPDLFK